MREPLRDRGRLEHILSAIDYIFEFAKGRTQESFSADRMLFFAVVKNIEIIGEAAYKLSETFRRKHGETPWPYIIKMRHVLVHDYYQISTREVWKVINEDLGVLRSQVVHYLEDTDWGAWESQQFDYSR